jgi:hypothetical protein
VPLVRVDSPDGKLRAVLFGAGVHNTTLGGENDRLCGDYAGFAEEYLQRELGVPALFVLGCAGDANPYPRGTMEITRRHGVTLAKEVRRVLDGKLRPIRGPLKIAFGSAALLLAMLNKGETPPSEYACPFTVWQFGEDLTLVALPGEVVIDYLLLLEKALGPNQLWVIAYSNDVFGYLPSARVLEEGGYETRGLYAGGAGYFAPEAEDVVVSKVVELARQAGRKLPE